MNNERCVVAGAMMGGALNQINNKYSESMLRPAELSPEQEAKLKADCEAKEKQYRKEAVSRAIVELAETMVLRGKTPEGAFAIATDFVTRASEILKTFNLPE